MIIIEKERRRNEGKKRKIGKNRNEIFTAR
jgi:hypothetical protein